MFAYLAALLVLVIPVLVLRMSRHRHSLTPWLGLFYGYLVICIGFVRWGFVLSDSTTVSSSGFLYHFVNGVAVFAYLFCVYLSIACFKKRTTTKDIFQKNLAIASLILVIVIFLAVLYWLYYGLSHMTF